MGRRRRVRDLAAEAAVAQAECDAAEQPPPEDGVAVHRAYELMLLRSVDVLRASDSPPAHIDRVSTGNFMWRLFELAPPGVGAFVDVGSGMATANLVSHVSLVWPKQFTRVHAVDLSQSLGVMVDVENMRRRVGGAMSGVSSGVLRHALRATADIVWWNVLNEREPTHAATAFAGHGMKCVPVATIFAEATFVMCVDLLFHPDAVDCYRRELARSLVDAREVTYVTCHPIGGRRLRTAPEGVWMHVGPGGTDDAHIGPYVTRCAKILARGGGVDVAWEATNFYLATVRGPAANVEVGIARAIADEDGGVAADAAAQSVTLAVREAYAAVNRRASVPFAVAVDLDLDSAADSAAAAAAGGAAAAAAAAPPPPGHGALTEPACSTLIEALCHGIGNDKLCDTSSFLDIGSGFGKLVLNCAVRAQATRRVAGVEIVRRRHTESVEVLDELRGRSAAWAARLASVSFTYADVTTDAFCIDSFTHVVMYDAVLDKDTHRAVFARLAASKTLVVFACFCNEQKLRARGWPYNESEVDLPDPLPKTATSAEKTADLRRRLGVELLRKMSLGTTGKQRFACNIYRRIHEDNV